MKYFGKKPPESDGRRIDDGYYLTLAEKQSDFKSKALLESTISVKRFITYAFGKRCKEYEKGCPNCDAWKWYDRFEENCKISAGMKK